MTQRNALLAALRGLKSDQFDELALQVFRYQATMNPVYARYLSLLGRGPEKIKTIQEIPGLPIRLFKHYRLQSDDWEPAQVFTSSGTTGTQTSQHAVRDLEAYLANARKGFRQFYGPVENYCILALLPAYLERQGSSLVAMAQDFINRSKYEQSGFFLYEHEALASILKQNEEKGIPTLLLGVSFALLDFAAAYPMALQHTIVMETGGMKGRRKEMTRDELHGILKQAFGLGEVHSEYGMTELFSQAYSKGAGWFTSAATMRVQIQDLTDPFATVRTGRSGTIQIIDLANLDTISFIATEDLGRVNAEGQFAVLGRVDYSDMRGCNLMVSDL